MFKVLRLWLLHVSVATAAPIILRTAMNSLCQPDYDSYYYLHYDCVEPVIINIIQPIFIVSQIIVVIPTPTAVSNEQKNENNIRYANPVDTRSRFRTLLDSDSTKYNEMSTASPVDFSTAFPVSITTSSGVDTTDKLDEILNGFKTSTESDSTKNIVMDTASPVSITTTSVMNKSNLMSTASPVKVTTDSPVNISTTSPTNIRSRFQTLLDSYSTQNIAMSNNTMKFTLRLTQTMDGENHSNMMSRMIEFPVHYAANIGPATKNTKASTEKQSQEQI